MWFLVLCLALFSPVYAQEEETEGPVYIVQAGDTLSSIALRFGVTVDDLLAVNDLANANQLFVGDLLVIPGLEGVSGVLETRQIPFGENLRSLSRRYQIPIGKLASLNRVVSPAELYVGSSLVLPISSNERPETGRATLAPGQTMLELAVVQDSNYWSMLGFNEIRSGPEALPGDVVLFPQSQGAGPAGLPSPVTQLSLSRVFHGETAVMRIVAGEDIHLTGRLGRYDLAFFAHDDGEYVALQGIHALDEPGFVPVVLEGQMPSGGRFGFSQLVQVESRGYIFETLTVPPALLDPETTEAEIALVREYVAEDSGAQLWQGLFEAPSPFADCINSSFGNRRSYNGSAFTYYHGGVDFCGGTGTEIFAPARGRVVFADELEVRGNYTLIDHGWGVYSGYLHQSELLVRAGEWVEPGQVIGLVGSTGRSTGAHLHWEIWVNGILVNPVDWLENEYP